MGDKSARAQRSDGCGTFAARIETRSAATGDGLVVAGYASTTESPYEMYDAFGPYTEVISRGAFGKTLAEQPKVQLLVNHGGLSLAQTTTGSLRLAEDENGLHFEADLNQKRSDAADLIEALRDGAVDECSFAFRVTRQKWSPDYDERRIDEVNLNRGDVSVVNLGANPNTPVAMRAADVDAWLDSLTPDALATAISRRSKRALDAEDVNQLTQALAWFSAVDNIVDEAQAALAAYLQVPNPDKAEANSAPRMSLDFARLL